MSLWSIAVPSSGGSGKPIVDLTAAAQGLAQVASFNIPTLKVGTLDSLMTISEETTKMDTFVGGVAKKIEKTYFDTFKAEAQEAREKQAVGSTQKIDENAPELRIDGKSALEYVMDWRWNEVRYPTRSPLPLLISIIIKDATKADEALKKQVAEYNEVRTSYTAIERKDQGTLLVKPIGPYVKSQPIETSHLTTLMLVVPKARQQEFLDTYETMEVAAAQREAEEAEKKALEQAERTKREAERKAALAQDDSEAVSSKSESQLAAEKARAAEKEEKEAEAKRVEAELADPAAVARAEADRREREEEEKRRNKKLPPGCNAVVPRSATILCNEPTDEFVLISVVVLKQGVEQYKNLCREKRFTVRPFKYDPEEDKAERERKLELSKKKKNLWNFLIRWCTTTYVEVFTAWLHLKAIRLYVESVLRYGLPYQCQAMLLNPQKGKEKPLRDVLKNLYARLAGSNANLTQALDPNEPDLSGLGADFYSYVYLRIELNE